MAKFFLRHNNFCYEIARLIALILVLKCYGVWLFSVSENISGKYANIAGI